jgi:hypothetical protein
MTLNAEKEKNQHNIDEHRSWEASLAYWHNECIYFNNVLLGILEKTEDPDDIEKIEKFKSGFDNLNERLTEVHNGIIAHEQAINDPFNTDFSEINLRHEQTRWRVEEFNKDFRELKNEFYKFVDRDCTY